MVCKTTSTSSRKLRGILGSTLVEFLLGLGIAGILMGVLASLMMFTARSFLALSNYSELNNDNRITMDTMTRDLRECNRVISCSATRLDVQDSDGATISYIYSPGTKILTRSKNGVNRTMVTQCEMLAFNLGTRDPIAGSFAVVPTSNVSQAKVVNVSWNCARTILGIKANSENVQTARIVIRKQS